MRAIVTVEIEIEDSIEKLYPNFIFNYEDKLDFLQHQIASLNHNLTPSEQKFYQPCHPNYDNPEYEIPNDGYKQKVLKVQIGDEKK